MLEATASPTARTFDPQGLMRMVAQIGQELDALGRFLQGDADARSKYPELETRVQQQGARLSEFRWLRTFPYESGAAIDALVLKNDPGEFISPTEYRGTAEKLAKLETAVRRLSRVLISRIHRPREDFPQAKPVSSAAAKAENVASLARQIFTGSLKIADAVPFRVLVNITDLCNYRCKTCHQSHGAANLPQHDLAYSDIGAFTAILSSVSVLQIAGFGEPLLSPITPKLIVAAKAVGVFCSIITNGSLLERLYDLPELDRIDISFDGASARVLEGLRTGANRQKILQGIRLLPDAQRRKVSFNVVVNRLNVEEISDIVALAIGLGLQEVALQSFHAYLPWHYDLMLRDQDLAELTRQVTRSRSMAEGSGVAVRDLVVRQADPRATGADPSAVFDVVSKAGTGLPPVSRASLVSGFEGLPDVDTDAGLFAWLRTVAPPRDEPDNDEPTEREASAALAVPYCLAPFNSMVLDADGTVRPCCQLNWSMGNINDEPIQRIWNSPAYLALREALMTQINLPGNCRRCTDSVRFGYLTEFLTAFERDGGDIGKIGLPPNCQLPPEVASKPVVAKLRAAPPAKAPIAA